MKHLKTFISALVLLAAFSCAKNQTDGNGQVSFEVEGSHEVADVTKSNVSEYTALPSAGDFTITIKDAESSEVWSGRLSDWNAGTLLPAGTYTVEAAYGSIEDEGFDKPYFAGENTFTVKGGETTSVSIPVTLGNTVVKLSFSEIFRNYFKDYSFVLTRNGAEIAAFAKGENKAAFVDGYKITIEGTLASETKIQTFSKEYTGLETATAYTLAFDVPNVDGASIVVSFNDMVEEIPLGDLELNE